MSTASSRSLHCLCDHCWKALRPNRVPPRLINAERDVCCHCGQMTDSGIYIREEPELWPCDGGHVDNTHHPTLLPGQRR